MDTFKVFNRHEHRKKRNPCNKRHDVAKTTQKIEEKKRRITGKTEVAKTFKNIEKEKGE